MKGSGTAEAGRRILLRHITQEQFENVDVAPAGCQVKRRQTPLAWGILHFVLVQEELADVIKAFHYGMMQERVSLVVNDRVVILK